MAIARYTINVYDEDFEVLKTLEAPGLKWGTLTDIVEKVAKGGADDIDTIQELMLAIFPKATAEDLKNCLLEDMVAVLRQVMAFGQSAGIVAKPGAKKAPAKGAKAKN